jgi:ATP-binding cassette subfamily F protein uup
VLVTHDRYLLDQVSTTVIGLDGLGGAGHFADYSQWEAWQEESQRSSKTVAKSLERENLSGSAELTAPSAKKKLSYIEAREYATLEQRIADAEAQLTAARAAYEDPAIASDAEKLVAAQTELDRAQKSVDQFYQRWEELENKIL